MLAARRRAADVFAATMVDFMSQQPDRPIRNPLAELSARDREHLAWVLANQPKRTAHVLAEGCSLARQYRRDYARYGGLRPYLARASRDKLETQLVVQLIPKVMATSGANFDEGPAVVRRRIRKLIEQTSPEELDRLNDLLLKEVWLVADVLPLDPPPKPEGWSAPDPRTYAPPATSLLERGPDLDQKWVRTAARSREWTKPEAHDMLVQMATDPGLLLGWPGEAASWAPYHAMTLLGELRPPGRGAELLRAVDIVERDDWISDHLFVGCLTAMGPAVEPLLWDVVNDRNRDLEVRGLGILALADIAGRYPARTEVIAMALANFMQHGALLDRKRKTVNASVALVLDQPPFEREASRSAILVADAAGRLDHKHFNPSEMEAFMLDGWGTG